MDSEIDIAIIGGGAAGVFAAISAAEKIPGRKISVFESGRKLLSKVLISGGGRCNVTNQTPDPRELVKNYPRGGRELLGPFTAFGVRETIAWFESRGVRLKTERDNRVFPITDSSSTIADCLLGEAKKHRINFCAGEKITGVSKEASRKFLLTSATSSCIADKLLIAAGGNEKSFSLPESLGHTIIPPVPSLFTFTITDPLLEGLSGVSFDEVKTMLHIDGKKFTHQAPLLITHWGLSGPAIIVLSSKAARELHTVNYNTTLKINFLPGLSTHEAETILTEYRSKHPNKLLASQNPFSLPSSFWERLIVNLFPEQNMICQSLSKQGIRALVQKLMFCEFTIHGKGVFKEEFVTAGGVSLREVNFKTMESKIIKDLYFAGEVLDIDGVTGGFNFQSAWTTGWIAGQSI
jgi:predicted Rossmann fold flavoprotein